MALYVRLNDGNKVANCILARYEKRTGFSMSEPFSSLLFCDMVELPYCGSIARQTTVLHKYWTSGYNNTIGCGSKYLRTYSRFTAYIFKRKIVSFVEYQKNQRLKQRHLKVFYVILWNYWWDETHKLLI